RRVASSPPIPPPGRGDAGDVGAPWREVRPHGAPASAATDRAEVPIAGLATAGRRPLHRVAPWRERQGHRPAADTRAHDHRPLGGLPPPRSRRVPNLVWLGASPAVTAQRLRLRTSRAPP